jgi:uracil-DNA glycosylase family 4
MTYGDPTRSAYIRTDVNKIMTWFGTHVIFGVGDAQAKLMFVGEAPGRDEDLEGEPFIGRAGQLLTRIIEAMGMTRQDVYLTNVIKCRPTNNRVPEADEIFRCEPYLSRQVALVHPRVIVALGTVAAQALLQTTLPISQLRGRFHTYQGVRVMPTFHPAFLLRSPERTRDVVDDMQMVQHELGESPEAWDLVTTEPDELTQRLLEASSVKTLRVIDAPEVSEAPRPKPDVSLLPALPSPRPVIDMPVPARDNQGVAFTGDQSLLEWEGLRFRSRSEIKIAQALDRKRVLFFPNCRARLGLDDRQTREADFLVCYRGRWGLLEVDGEPFHPPSRTVADHARDRLFKEHGIRLVEHFDASECFQNPDEVVRRFLALLEALA